MITSMYIDFLPYIPKQVYKQKVKHLLYEHQNNISELKAESTVALKLAQDEHRSNELDLRKDKRTLKVEIKEQQLSHEDVIKNLKKVSKYPVRTRSGTYMIKFKCHFPWSFPSQRMKRSLT